MSDGTGQAWKIVGYLESDDSYAWTELEGALGPIRATVRRAKNPKGAVIICHGFKGFSQWGFFPHLAREITTAGFNAITFNFSGSGVGEDGETWSDEDRFSRNTFTGDLHDLDRVVAATRDWHGTDGKFGLFGHSRGGGVAILHAASDENVKALVTWNSISTVRRWDDAEEKVWRERGYTEIENSRTKQVFKMGTALLDDVEKNHNGSLDIAAAAARVKAPWLILHGESDETVRTDEARHLHEASGKRAELRILPGNHGFGAKHPLDAVPQTLERATAETVSFFVKHIANG